ncbi:MAG: hypothetical protein MUD14_29325, partial [Hydrococcus sp. Prado102]|nr:hypothetical protein [Hydrococcus sp. Prado102]
QCEHLARASKMLALHLIFNSLMERLRIKRLCYSSSVGWVEATKPNIYTLYRVSLLLDTNLFFKRIFLMRSLRRRDRNFTSIGSFV